MRYSWAVLVNIPAQGAEAARWQMGHVGAWCCEPHTPGQGTGLPVMPLGLSGMWHANLERAKLQGGLHRVPKDPSL